MTFRNVDGFLMRCCREMEGVKLIKYFLNVIANILRN
jgi:hypothetical protein